jgi:hypothetical protein
LAALLLSAVFHVVLLVFLVRYLPPPPVYRDAPSIEVSLVPPLRTDRSHRAVARPGPPDSRDVLARAEPVPPIPSLSPSPAGAATAPSTSGDGAPSDADLAAKGRQVFRGLRGCDRVGMTREERERCEAERWARAAPASPRLNLDPSGRYARNPEPFLSRRPKDGCRARMAGDVDGMGNDSNVRAGVTCVIPF